MLAQRRYAIREDTCIVVNGTIRLSLCTLPAAIQTKDTVSRCAKAFTGKDINGLTNPGLIDGTSGRIVGVITHGRLRLEVRLRECYGGLFDVAVAAGNKYLKFVAPLTIVVCVLPHDWAAYGLSQYL